MMEDDAVIIFTGCTLAQDPQYCQDVADAPGCTNYAGTNNTRYTTGLLREHYFLPSRRVLGEV